MKGNRPESVRLRQKPGSMGQLQLDNDMGAWDPTEVPRFQADCLQTLAVMGREVRHIVAEHL